MSDLYAQGFKDGQWSVHRAGTGIVHEDFYGHLTLSFEPANCDSVLISRELLESMIKSLNESNGENSRAAD